MMYWLCCRKMIPFAAQSKESPRNQHDDNPHQNIGVVLAAFTYEEARKKTIEKFVNRIIYAAMNSSPSPQESGDATDIMVGENNSHRQSPNFAADRPES